MPSPHPKTQLHSQQDYLHDCLGCQHRKGHGPQASCGSGYVLQEHREYAIAMRGCHWRDLPSDSKAGLALRKGLAKIAVRTSSR